jgi:hypothetical protein
MYVNNHPIGENSSNLITLLYTNTCFRSLHSKTDGGGGLPGSGKRFPVFREQADSFPAKRTAHETGQPRRVRQQFVGTLEKVTKSNTIVDCYDRIG